MRADVQHIYMMDSKGLITTKRGDKLPQHKKLMAHGDDVPVIKELKDVIAYVKPHALIGLTGAGPAFKKVRLSMRSAPQRAFNRSQPSCCYAGACHRLRCMPLCQTVEYSSVHGLLQAASV